MNLIVFLGLVVLSESMSSVLFIKNTKNEAFICSDFYPKMNFNMSQFLGKWYIIASQTERGDSLTDCMGVEFSITPQRKSIIVLDIFRHSGKVFQSILQQSAKYPVPRAGYLKVLTSCIEKDQDYVILEASTNSALILTCQDTNFSGDTELIEVNFLSRGPALLDSTYERFVNILENYGIKAELVPSEQEECK